MRAEAHAQRARDSVLSVGTLARFVNGLSWNAILDITNGHEKSFWRCAVADAEDKGLLAWSRAERVWRLTPAGRAVTRGIS